MHEVGVAGGGAAEGVGLVGDLDVQRVAVGVGVDGDRADARVAAGAGDADGDLAAVGDQHLADGWHGRTLTGRRRVTPVSSGVFPVVCQ